MSIGYENVINSFQFLIMLTNTLLSHVQH